MAVIYTLPLIVMFFVAQKYILISLREVKNRGDIDEFNIEWGVRDSFLRRSWHGTTHCQSNWRRGEKRKAPLGAF
jgi:hypothetical protein